MVNIILQVVVEEDILQYQIGVKEEEVREAFRRMNANNVPLNAEEQRNAQYQGEFKWFIVNAGDKMHRYAGVKLHQ